MNWRVWGPLLFATMLFIVASAIKLVAFQNYGFLLELAPELSLWSTGVLFSLAVSEHTQLGGRAQHEIRPSQSGSGIEVTYRVALPERLEFSPRMIYLFVYSMTSWILNILIAGKATMVLQTGSTWRAAILVGLGFALAGASVGVAHRSLREVA